MSSTTVLSGNLVKTAAIDANVSLRQINGEADFGPGYIYTILDTDRCQLSTVHRIVATLGSVLAVRVADLLEEVKVAEPIPAP